MTWERKEKESHDFRHNVDKWVRYIFGKQWWKSLQIRHYEPLEPFIGGFKLSLESKLYKKWSGGASTSVQELQDFLRPLVLVNWAQNIRKQVSI